MPRALGPLSRACDRLPRWLGGGGKPARSLRKADTVRHLLEVLALGLALVVPGSAPDGSIEGFIDREMPASGVPGLAYAVVADDEIRSMGARGVVKIGGEVDVTPDTAFVIGSISKSFTALAVMQLVEAGKVDLDAEISQYLDAFSGQPAGHVTIRQLLSHTSGFSTLQGNTSAVSSGAGDTDGKDALERSVDARVGVTPAYSPGERWEYSNVNYQILGRLIEVVSRQEFQTYVTSNILEPVGMEHSFVADGEIHDTMATGHTSWFTTKRAMAQNPTDRARAPQGGIIASASDLALYMQMMMNGQDDVLSAEGKATMMHPASAAAPAYGFGWYVDQAGGTVWHTGTSPGFESLAWMDPAQKKGAIVLVNAVGGVGFAETTELRTGIAATGWGSTTAARAPASPRRHCSSAWRSCRSCTWSACSGRGVTVRRYAPSRASPAGSACGSRC